MARKTTKKTTTKAESPQEQSTHEVLLDDKASKLSPKHPGFVYFQIGRHLEKDVLALRLKGNDGGGLHSKEWIPLTSIIALLEQQEPGKPFKSGLFKAAFVGGSANNASFLAAVLRSKTIALLDSSEKSMFLHLLPEDFESRRDVLLALAAN